METLYRLIVWMSLVIFVTGQTPFVLNATADQQMAASDNDRLSNITQLFANRTDPVLLNEEGIASYLTSPVIKLTTTQEQELAQNFGPLMSTMGTDVFDDLLCPTSQDGQLLLYLTMEQDGSLLQVITKIPFGKCLHRNPPGSCIGPTTLASLRCYCCVRYRTVVVLVVKVSSCSTGSCQLILVEVTVPYCTCCQSTTILITSSTDGTNPTTPTEMTTTPTELTTPTHSTKSTTPSYRTTQRNTYWPRHTTARSTTEMTTTPTELTTPTHSINSRTPSYRTTQRSTYWPRHTTTRSTTTKTSSERSSTRQTTQTTLSNETTNSD